MTQYPSYGLQCAKEELLLSWVLMGRVYPVTEKFLGPDNLLGKPMKKGFDSHYILTKRQGMRASSVQKRTR